VPTAAFCPRIISYFSTFKPYIFPMCCVPGGDNDSLAPPPFTFVWGQDQIIASFRATPPSHWTPPFSFLLCELFTPRFLPFRFSLRALILFFIMAANPACFTYDFTCNLLFVVTSVCFFGTFIRLKNKSPYSVHIFFFTGNDSMSLTFPC